MFLWGISTSQTSAGFLMQQIGNSPGRPQGRPQECVGDNFLTQMVKEPTRGSKLLLFVNRKGLVRDGKVGGPLAHSDREMPHFSVHVEPQKRVSRTATLDSQRANFKLSRTMVERLPWEIALKGVGKQEGQQFFRKLMLKVQELTISKT